MKYSLRSKLATYGTKKDRRMLIGLGFLSIFTHFHWLFDPRVFTSGDWWFLSLDKYRDFVTLSPVWVTDGFGGTSATPGFYGIRFLEGLLTTIGSSFAFNEKLFFFLPIIFIGTFGTYLFLRQYFKEWLAFVGTIVFAFNTAMLFNYAGALTIAVADALTPLTLFFFRQLLRNPKNTRWLLATGVSFTVMALYEMRIALLVMGIAAAYFLFMWLTDTDKKAYLTERIAPIIKLGVILFALQAFWIIPYVIGSRSGVTFSNLLGQGLFVSFSDIQNGLTLRHPFWTNARPATFIVQAIPLYAWLIPVIAFGGLFFKRQRISREVGFWALLAILGLFLVKQVNEPLASAYPWIFAHVPGFAAFRESSKFYLLISLAYAVLIPYGLGTIRVWLQTHLTKRIRSVSLSKVAYIGLSVAIVLLFAINMKPLLTGELRTLYVPRHMPADYVAWNDFVRKQPGYFRTMWMPTVSRWALQNSQHPSLNATSINQGEWLTQLSESNLAGNATMRDKATNIFQQPSSDTFLDQSSVKYVVVPIRDTANEDDFLHNYGDDRQYYLDVLDHTSYLQRVDAGTKELAVYENTGFKPHVSTAANLQSYDLSGAEDTNALYSFATKTLRQDFVFADQVKAGKRGTTYPGTNITDPFRDVTSSAVSTSAINKQLPGMKQPVVYIDATNQEMRYTIQNNTVTFYKKPRNNLQANGQHVGSAAAAETVAATQRIVPGGLYALAVGGSTLTFDGTKNSSASLGVPDGPVMLYAATGPNTVPNGSFEDGLWQQKVDDCNAYDKQGLIDMSVTQDDPAEGKQSLQLESDKHTACTQTGDVPISGAALFLNFSHKAIGAQKAGYQITFNDAAKTTVKKDIATDGTWHTQQAVVQIPKGASQYKLKFFGYPDYRFRFHAVINYDNVQVIPLTTLTNITKQPTTYSQAALPSSRPFTLSYQNKDPNQGKNLIQNGSFTEGAWQKKPADCDDYDPNPVIGMSVVSRKNNGKALELRAKRHAACTTKQGIPVEQGNRYLFTFDYESPNASRASYTITYNDVNHTRLEGSLPIKQKGTWSTFTKQLQAPLGATGMSVTVYAYGNDSGSITFINHYSDFALVKLATIPGQYYVVSDTGKQKLAKPRDITSEKRGSTRETIHVKGATTPFYVSQSESFNPLWRLALTNDKSQGAITKLLPWAPANAVGATDHIMLNDYQNGWYVDPAALCQGNPAGCTKHSDGSYDLELTAEFTSQRWFYFGSVITFTATICVIAYLLYGRSTKARGKGHRS
jgi:hypothetical protein